MCIESGTAPILSSMPREELVARDAGQIERRGRHEEDLVARAREVELLLAAVFEEADNRLARAAEVGDGVADFLRLAPERGGAGRPDDDARDPAIDFGLAERLDQRAHRRRRLEELADDAAGFHFLEVGADPEDERGVAGDLRLAPDEERHDDEPADREDDRDDDEDEHEPHAASGSHNSSPAGSRFHALPRSSSIAVDRCPLTAGRRRLRPPS